MLDGGRRRIARVGTWQFFPISGFSRYTMGSHATGDNRADVESHNIPHQVGDRAGCDRVEPRASETGSGRAGERQEAAINILRGGR